MKIESISLIEGKNINSHFPVVIMRLNLQEYSEVTTKVLGVKFINRLLGFLPGLIEHKCSKGYRGGFIDRLHEGTLLGHVVEHVALEIQEVMGIGTYYGKTRRVDEGIYNVIFEYKSADAAYRIAQIAVESVKEVIKNNTPSLETIKKELTEILDKTELGPSTKAIIKAAKKRNIPVTRLDKNSLIQLGYGSKSVKLQATITEKTSCISVDLACDKALTKDRLRRHGLPVPFGRVCIKDSEALEFADKIKKPIVVKPVDGNQGKGVSLSLTKNEDIKTAFELSQQYCKEVLVEEYIEGNHYRCAVVNGELVAAAWRIPAHVIGDGLHTVSELMDIENLNPLRGEFHEKPLTKLKYDPIVKQVLSRQKLSIDSIPKKGCQVFLRENANLSTGGIAYDVTDMIHQDNKRLVEEAVKVIGLDVAGVDIVLDDIENSYIQFGGAIIEINAAPGLRMHHYPAQGKSRDVASKIVDYLYPNNETGRIPIVTVTGTNGKTTTVRLIANMLQNKYARVGYTTSDGIYVNKQCILAGDTTGPVSTQNILERKDVDAAVLELARGGILKGGLAYDYSDIAIVTNIGYDHIGQNGIYSQWELADLKALTIESVNKLGYAIINADDKYASTMSKSARCRIIYFTLKDNNKMVIDHINCGEKAVILKGNNIVVYDSLKEHILGDINSIPISFKGKATYNIANVLAAVAAGLAANVKLNYIIKSLKEFSVNIHNNPGRQTMIETPSGHNIMIDYAHNQQALTNLGMFVKKMEYNNSIAVLCAPGDRSDSQLIEMGKIAATMFNKVIFKEDIDLRGREKGETAKLLLDGYLQERPDGKAYIFHEETKAVKKALEMASSNDIIIINYENLGCCLNSIKQETTNFFVKSQKNLTAGA